LLIVGTTMIPTGIRHPSLRYIDNVFHPADVVNNILLYMPLGIAVGSSFFQAVLWGAGVSTLAEFLQLGYVDRTPSLADVASNTLGAVLGYFVAKRFVSRRARRPLTLPLPRWLAVAAIPAALLGTLALLHNRPAHDFSNWNPAYQLVVGNEADGGRPWNGTLSAVAIYPFAMPSAEISALAKVGRVFPAATGQTPIYGPLPADVLKAQFNQPLLSPQRQQTFYNALTQSNQLTILINMQTPDLGQHGPARIVTYSADAWGRNFTLGQNLNGLAFRLRTPATGGNGTDPALYTGPVLEANRQTMVAAVYDGRWSSIYVDGKLMAQTDLAMRRPRFPRKFVAILPTEIPLREVELVSAEIILSCVFAVGVFGQFGVPRPLWTRYRLGCAAGLVIALIICAFDVTHEGLALRIILECVVGGFLISASVEPDAPVR
jgi:VanZ like family/Concanavalin A-like lectin/glucanases superfamily